MARLVYKDRIGITLEAKDGEELTPEFVTAYAQGEIAEQLDLIQHRLEAFTDTYNHYQGLNLQAGKDD